MYLKNIPSHFKAFFLFAIIYHFYGVHSPVSAGTNPFSFSEPPNFSITSIGEFVAAILSLLFIIGGILVFVYLVWGGLQWITAGGDKAAHQAARERITGALIGFSIMALALAIVYIAQYFFGVQIIGNGAIPRGF